MTKEFSGMSFVGEARVVRFTDDSMTKIQQG